MIRPKGIKKRHANASISQQQECGSRPPEQIHHLRVQQEAQQQAPAQQSKKSQAARTRALLVKATVFIASFYFLTISTNVYMVATMESAVNAEDLLAPPPAVGGEGALVAAQQSKPAPKHYGKSSQSVTDGLRGSKLTSTQGEGTTKNRLPASLQSNTASVGASQSVATTSPSSNASIHVVTANHHYFGPKYEQKVPNCMYKEKLMDCVFTKPTGKDADKAGKADVLLYHMPNAPLKLKREYPGQILAGMSMEPGSYYKNQQDPEFLKQLDIRMYYNRTSEVPLVFSNQFLETNGVFQPVRKTADKLPMLTYINSNCGAHNGRNNIVKGVMDIGDIEVHSFGICLRNRKGGGRGVNKMEILSKYKFCIAMENSNEIDYVSEKLWQSLQAGCLPVYFGAPNIADFLPVPVNKSIINYADFGSPKALSDELVRLNNDDKAYNEFFEWKKLDPRKDKVLPGFRWLVEVSDRGHCKCELCRYAMKLLEDRKHNHE